MRIGELMSSPATTVDPGAPITEAGRLLLARGITAVCVVDAGGRLVGVVSRSDLLRHRLVRDPRAHLRPVAEDDTEPPHTVAEVMTKDVLALAPSADEADAAQLMLDNRIRSLPVVEDGRVVGIVSVTDLLRAAVRGDERIAADVTEPATRAEPASGTSGPRDHRDLLVLTLEDCLARLRSAPVGRLAFVHNGSPQVLPVNHQVDGMTIVFRTTWGSKLEVARSTGPAAFEVDGFDPATRTGWSVLVRGTVSAVYDAHEIERYDALGVPAWARIDSDPVWVALRPDEITGREITRA